MPAWLNIPSLFPFALSLIASHALLLGLFMEVLYISAACTYTSKKCKLVTWFMVDFSLRDVLALTSHHQNIWQLPPNWLMVIYFWILHCWFNSWLFCIHSLMLVYSYHKYDIRYRIMHSCYPWQVPVRISLHKDHCIALSFLLHNILDWYSFSCQLLHSSTFISC
jgi:hypothetical protein